MGVDIKAITYDSVVFVYARRIFSTFTGITFYDTLCDRRSYW